VSNAIGWCDRTVNPVFGCRNGCSYCYARALAPRVAAMRAAATGQPVCEDCRTFTPHLHPERLKDIGKGRGQVVFIGSMCDLWGDGVERWWRGRIWCEVPDAPNQYVVLTKRPERIEKQRETVLGREIALEWPENLWLGTSITGEFPRAVDQFRINSLRDCVPPSRRVVSVEPLLGSVLDILETWQRIAAWLIVGPQTGPGAVPPQREWVAELISYADETGTPLWLKSGCYDLWPDLPMRQERPAAMVAACEAGRCATR